MIDRPVFRAWAAVALMAGFIFAVSSISRPFPVDPSIARWRLDWAFHAVEYAFFGYFLTRAFSLTYNFRSALALAAVVFVTGTLYGVSDEWHQRYVPGRDSDARDVAADAVGVLVGTSILLKKTKGSASHA